MRRVVEVRMHGPELAQQLQVGGAVEAATLELTTAGAQGWWRRRADPHHQAATSIVLTLWVFGVCEHEGPHPFRPPRTSHSIHPTPTGPFDCNQQRVCERQ